MPRGYRKAAQRQQEQGNICVACRACGGPTTVFEAFRGSDGHYHPICAGVWRCNKCGNFYEGTKKPCGCGQGELQ